MPSTLSKFLHRSRLAILALLLVVLPLQGVVQVFAGMQGQRHMHAASAPADAALHGVLSHLTRPLRALLDELHAAQAPQLQSHKPAWVVSTGPADGLHEHGGVYHEHSQNDADVIEVADPTEDSLQGGATAFLAWLPAALRLPSEHGSHRPAAVVRDWRDRVVAPPLTPPRG